jgi:hypothetical protein
MTEPPDRPELADLPGATTASFQMFPRRRPWLLGLCLPLALACAFIPAASLHHQAAPGWLVAVVVAVFFPLLPLIWHLVAERGRPGKLSMDGGALERLSVRALAVGLLVLGISLANLGPRALGRSLLSMARPGGAPPAAGTPSPATPRPAAPPPGAPAPARHELEPYIPADARSVLALSDGTVLRQLLAGAATDQATREKLAAFEKCQILPDQAKVLVAGRGGETRLIVLRAPGVTDPRNLYCLAGVLGSERMRLRFTSDKAPIRFEVEGLFPRTLKFTAVDERTVMAVDGPWGEAVERKLFPPGSATSEGMLLPVLDRIDRGASLWSAGVFATSEGAWDLAMDARVQGGQLRLRASSVPASGPSNKAVVETSVPMAFFSALPGGALRDGLQALLAALATPGDGPPPAPAAPPGNPGTAPARKQ